MAFTRSFVLFLILLVPALTACGGGGAHVIQSPEARVRAFAAAVQDERFPEAYAMLAKDYRRQVSLDEFRSQVQENPDEVRETTTALSRVSGPAREEATLPFGHRDEVKLVREDGVWQLTTNIADVYDQSTPRAALRTFVEAMERGRYEVVLRLVPNADKEGVTAERMRETWEGESREEIDRLLSNLREHLDNPIEQVGNRATMPYGERFRVSFLRENGLWKIEDPD